MKVAIKRDLYSWEMPKYQTECISSPLIVIVIIVGAFIIYFNIVNSKKENNVGVE